MNKGRSSFSRFMWKYTAGIFILFMTIAILLLQVMRIEALSPQWQDPLEMAMEQQSDLLSFYQNAYDQVYAENLDYFNSMAASGDTTIENTYYTFQYVLAPTLSMFEATGEAKYLEQALTWAETMVSKAIIIDVNGNRNWSGPWQSPHTDTPISYLLNDLQGSTELARLVRIVLTDPNLKNQYGDRAQVIYAFVRDEIVEKNLWVRGGMSWFINVACVVEEGKPTNDKVVLLLRILSDLLQVDANPKYGDLAQQLAECFKGRFTSYQGGMIWDLGIGYDGNPSEDTSHANRHPWAVIELYQADLVFTREYVDGLANLLLGVIWNGSLDDPMFTNFIDGSNDEVFGREPWNNGLIYAGWVMLGQFNQEVQEVCDAVLDAILAGKNNPSLSYNRTIYGKLSLAGHLARNLVFADWQSEPTFADVPVDHWAHDAIEVLYKNGYITGCSTDPLLYCPEDIMTRAESAVFVERGIHGADYMPVQPQDSLFADVPLGEWYAKWSHGLWEDGYTSGCGTNPLIYCPLQQHTRAEGAVFFLRMLNGAEFEPPEAQRLFVDVDPVAWEAKWVEAAYLEGIMEPCDLEAMRFCPDEPLRRAAAASIMVKAKRITLP
jgi:hypothetical protein